MYINNLINTLNDMDENTLSQFKKYAYLYQIEELHNRDLERSQFNRQLKKFMDKEFSRISYHYFDCYLYALDKIEKDGAKKAIFQSNSNIKINNWRKLFISISSDMPLPRGIDASHLDEQNLRLIKSILQKLISLGSGYDKNETSYKLNTINNTLDLFIDMDKHK